MKSFSKSIQSLCIATTLLVPLTAKCDIFVLKDGTRLKGKIIDQTYEYYTLKYEVIENVLREKKVLVKDVVEIIKDDASIKDYKRIKKLFPTSDFLSLKDYETIKKKYFIKFYTDHPRSKHKGEVEKLQKQLDKEYKTLKDGGAKIDGELLSKGNIDANKYEVEAILLLKELEHDIKAKKHISALRIFEKLERNYKHTRPFPNAVIAIQEILPEFIISVTELSDSVDDELKKKEKYIDRLPSREKKRITDLLAKEVIDYQTSLLNAKEVLKTKWLPLNKYEKAPIDVVLKFAISEQKRIEKLSEQKFEDGGKIYRMILAAIESKDPDSGTKLLSQFQRMSPPESYLVELKEGILATKGEAEARKEREKQAALEAYKAKAAAAAAKRKAEREEAAKKKKKEDSSLEDKALKKLNIDKQKKLLKEAEELTK